jgi:hypothetical protein
MASLKQAPRSKQTGYRGKQAKTGNSLGIRFDKALFQSHPEFSGEVRAHVIAPGRMLVVAEPVTRSRKSEEDPVLEAFLSFLASDMTRSPRQIRPLEQTLAKRVDALVGRLPVDPDEDLGDEPLV